MIRSTHHQQVTAGLITFVALFLLAASALAQDCTGPVGQDYWHRQCPDVNAIEAGMNSHGHKKATTADFEELTLCASGRLMSSFPLDFPAYPDTCDGLNADPSKRPLRTSAETADRPYTKRLFWQTSGWLWGRCPWQRGVQRHHGWGFDSGDH